MTLNRNKIFFIGVSIILLFITINRVDFLIGSCFTKGKVIKIDHWQGSRGSRYFAPVVEFSDSKYNYTFEGETYSELKVGEEIDVVYHESNPLDAEIFSFVGFLMAPLIYALLPLLILAAAIFSFIAKNETVSFSMKGISRNKPLDLKAFNEKESVNYIASKSVTPKVRRR